MAYLPFSHRPKSKLAQLRLQNGMNSCSRGLPQFGHFPSDTVPLPFDIGAIAHLAGGFGCLATLPPATQTLQYDPQSSEAAKRLDLLLPYHSCTPGFAP